MSRPSAEDERWHVDGQPNDETFANESAAIARAWELTPPGGKRPAVRRAAVMRGQELRGVELDEIFDVPEHMLGSTGNAHMSPSTPRLDARLTEAEMKFDGDGRYVEAEIVASLRMVEEALQASGGPVAVWAQRVLKELVEERMAGGVVVEECSVRVEEDPPKFWGSRKDAVMASSGSEPRLVVTGRLVPVRDLKVPF